MPSIRRNGSYTTDPALASAFDNLASAFATPSGADVAGYARGSAEREKATRIAELFANPNDPNFDRKNIAVGNYTPVQSFFAQNQNDGTTRRGQDVSAKASTDVAGINNAGALARQFALPVSAKDGETVMLPAQTAAATGLPGMFRGNVTTKPGDTVTLPGDGGVIRGAPIVPTDSQVKGAILQGLPGNEQRAVATAGVSLAPVLDKSGEPTNDRIDRRCRSHALQRRQSADASRELQDGRRKGRNGFARQRHGRVDRHAD
jgi:hypothetical protein